MQAINLYAQIEVKTNAILLKRDFNAFKKFIAAAPGNRKPIYFNSEMSREVVDGFRESVFTIVKSHKSDSSIINVTINCQVNIITQGNLIIYYHLERKEFIDFPKSYKTKDTVYTFSDSSRLAAMRSKFKNCFLAPLNENELFVDTIYYGSMCGHSRQEQLTPQQAQIKEWVVKRDTANLFKWLQSTNTERQVYAVQGFHSLHFMRVKISDEAKRLISYIIKKKGNIQYCGICDAGLIDISRIVEKFTFAS